MEARTAPHKDVATSPGRWVRAFPLIRHLSRRVTPVLSRLPFTPNQITAASLAFGLGCAWCFSRGEWGWGIVGAALLVIGCLLDNCDGEIARIKGLSTRFGHFFDSFVDWVVDSAFFAALGYGVARQSGEAVWLWLGLATAAGATVNYILELRHDVRVLHGARSAPNGQQAMENTVGPELGEVLPSGWKEAAVYVFRELSHADFCFIVLALSLFDLTWLLLPVGAVGAQVYWMTAFVMGWRKFHV